MNELHPYVISWKSYFYQFVNSWLAPLHSKGLRVDKPLKDLGLLIYMSELIEWFLLVGMATPQYQLYRVLTSINGLMVTP